MRRAPNGKKVAAEKVGVAVTDRGFINVGIQMRANVPHIFAIGKTKRRPKASRLKKGLFPWTASGRASPMAAMKA